MHNLQFKKQHERRDGLTLVELLVVVTILMILLGVVLPLASPNVKGRKIREAARQVNTAFAGAKARSEGSGKKSGLIIFPDENNPSRAFRMAFAKTARVFAGVDSNSVVTVAPRLNNTDDLSLTFDVDSKLRLEQLLRIRETSSLPPAQRQDVGSLLIRFKHQGRWFRCTWSRNTNLTTASFAFVIVPSLNDTTLSSLSSFVPRSGVSGPSVLTNVPYEIQLPPEPSAAAGIVLPTGTHIDLNSSLLGSAPGATSPFAIMFDQSGQPDQTFQGGTVGQIRGNFAALVVDGDVDPANVLTPEVGSMWIAVDHRTGQVRTLDNVGSDFALVSGGVDKTSSDGVFDRFVVYDINGNGNEMGGDVNGDGVADDVNGDGDLNILDAADIAGNAISASKAGGR